ncbi:unnamed protein product [Gongylonema pulchrum]|uniref:Uncharacterized protein n=1 Tax=Gongylonema pulchrum TaxID=637853 RepID=A0A183DN99_9BILA|nr:unnamed protein product [Gongylonema pulchrum]
MHLGQITATAAAAAVASHSVTYETRKPVATVTPLSLPASVLVPATVNPAFFAATVQQQQHAQLQAVAAAAAASRSSTIAGYPISQPSSLLIGIDTLAGADRKAASSAAATAAATATGPVVLTAVGSASRKKGPPDSRWSGADDKHLFLAGPRLKLLRRRVCQKKITRRIALHPCQSCDFVVKQWPNLQGFFI